MSSSTACSSELVFQGWQYFPAAPNSGQCCGKCKPVACVCEGEQHKIGEHWTSPDHCTHYTCVDTNGTIQVQSSNESCPEVSVEVQKQFVIQEEVVPGTCCKTQELVACRVGNKIYQEGQTWPSQDPCKNYTCARDVTGRLTHKESVETCVRDCQRGWLYAEAPGGICCGHCVQDSCLVDDELKQPGTTWYSADNCTTYTCDRDGDSVAVTLSRQTCPDMSHCDPEDRVNETCCQVCREKPPALSTCVPTSLGLESVGLIRVQLHGRGLCVNTRPVDQFKECRGTCDSGTVYNNQTGSHDSRCECCQALKYAPVTVELTCEDGSKQQHRVASPTACGCRRCGGGFLPWPERSTWVPIARQAQCEEPKKMECGYGQVLKQKTSDDGCQQFTCECKPASECEHIPTANEVDILEPGMDRVIDTSSCCPRVLMLCKPETCPAPPDCPKHHELRSSNVTGKCCSVYECEAPKDKCIVSLEWEATPKGGEKPKDKPQVVLKDIDAVWVDGPCRWCRCEGSPLGPATRCSTTECPPIVATDQFVLEPKPVPFACCPDAVYVACRDGDNIYRVGENWTSPDNVCESYECVQADDNKLEKITNVQKCHTDCDKGWQYFPAAPNSGQCCGKCKPVACVCEGEQHKIGEHWTSPDHCTHYTCVDTNGTIQVQSSNESCPEVSVEVQKQFVIQEEVVPGTCCKTQELVACRVGNKIYQEGQTWPSQDPCKNYTCARDVTGRLTHKESVETCVRDCQRGWLYAEAPGGICCGHCVQDSCLVDDELKQPGTTWYSADNCTTYTCDRDGDSVAVTLSRQTCPDMSHCDPEDRVNETCCQVCREKPPALSTCVPTSLGLESVGLIRVQLHGRGLCVNTRPVDQFKECRGTCDSGTVYNNQTGSHDSRCECCQALKYAPVTVELTCEDGSKQQHRVASPTACGCRRCGGGFLPWPERSTWASHTEVPNEIPEIYQRFGSTEAPRKH